MSVEVIRAAALSVPHGFLGRRGGVSAGEMAGLNVGYGSGDDRDAIAQNRALAIAAVLPGAELATVHQVHSADVVVVENAMPIDRRQHCDAMVTKKPGLLLGILTADCAPVLLADVEAGVVGAAHAGWRGAVNGVTDSTIAAMEWLGAKRHKIVAAIGPCIAQASYEVDAEFCRRLVEADDRNARFFASFAGRSHFDLEGFLTDSLNSAGVRKVEALHLNTYSEPDRFYSYRRSTHRGEADYGRQIAMIAVGGR